MTVADESGEMQGTLHRGVLNEHPAKVGVGAALALTQVWPCLLAPRLCTAAAPPPPAPRLHAPARRRALARPHRQPQHRAPAATPATWHSAGCTAATASGRCTAAAAPSAASLSACCTRRCTAAAAPRSSASCSLLAPAPAPPGHPPGERGRAAPPVPPFCLTKRRPSEARGARSAARGGAVELQNPVSRRQRGERWRNDDGGGDTGGGRTCPNPVP